MTTPQVPVYGMVRSALSAHLATGREAYFLCSSVSDCILSLSPPLRLVCPPSQAPSSNESSNGGRSHDAPTACYVQPASPESHQSLWAHSRDTGTDWKGLAIRGVFEFKRMKVLYYCKFIKRPENVFFFFYIKQNATAGRC